MRFQCAKLFCLKIWSCKFLTNFKSGRTQETGGGGDWRTKTKAMLFPGEEDQDENYSRELNVLVDVPEDLIYTQKICSVLFVD